MSVGGQKGSKNESGTSSGTSAINKTEMPIAPEGWEDAWRSILKMGGDLASDTTDGQKKAGDYFSSQLNGTDGTLGNVNDNISGLNTDLYGQTRGYLQGVTQGSAPQYATPAPVSSQTVGARDASAMRGSDYMGAYQQPYQNQVIDAATADLLKQYGGAQNRSNMAATAGGGISNSRTGLRDAEVANDFMRTLAGTTANLRNTGFNQSAAYGLQDAANATGVNVGNADRTLSADMGSAQMDLSGQMANAQNQLSTNQLNNNSYFNQQGQGLQASGQQSANLNQIGNNLQNYLNNTWGQGQVNSGNAQNLAGISQQGFGNYLQSLLAGSGLFGQQTDATGSTTGATAGSGNSSQKGASASGLFGL
jgi:hypothetical protein